MIRAGDRKKRGNAEATLLSCIERIHRAALEWSAALEMVAELVGGTGVTLLAGGADGGLMPLGAARVDDDRLGLLLDSYSDPLSNPGLQLMMARPPGSLLLPQHLGGPDHPFYRSELYHEMYRAQGMVPGTATMLLNDSAGTVGFALNRPEAKGPLDQAEIALLEHLVAHLRIARCREHAANETGGRALRPLRGAGSSADRGGAGRCDGRRGARQPRGREAVCNVRRLERRGRPIAGSTTR